MQKFNKSSIKATLAHTWFYYPVGATVVALIWIWSFAAFHQPSAHQSLEVFFAADKISDDFLDDIQAKYDKEQLRRISPSFASPDSGIYYEKMKIAISNADILVITKKTFETYKSAYAEYFAPINEFVQEKTGVEQSRVLENGYSILLKGENEENYLSKYMTFDSQDYYIAFNAGSKNLGAAIKEDNAPYDNALTFVKYLLEGK